MRGWLYSHTIHSFASMLNNNNSPIHVSNKPYSIVRSLQSLSCGIYLRFLSIPHIHKVQLHQPASVSSYFSVSFSNLSYLQTSCSDPFFNSSSFSFLNTCHIQSFWCFSFFFQMLSMMSSVSFVQFITFYLSWWSNSPYHFQKRTHLSCPVWYLMF